MGNELVQVSVILFPRLRLFRRREELNLEQGVVAMAHNYEVISPGHGVLTESRARQEEITISNKLV